MKKRKYCSSCRHSKYVIRDGTLRLQCECCQVVEAPRFLTTNCTYALDCKLFNPERKEDVKLRSKAEWISVCKHCGVDYH